MLEKNTRQLKQSVYTKVYPSQLILAKVHAEDDKPNVQELQWTHITDPGGVLSKIQCHELARLHPGAHITNITGGPGYITVMVDGVTGTYSREELSGNSR